MPGLAPALIDNVPSYACSMICAALSKELPSNKLQCGIARAEFSYGGHARPALSPALVIATQAVSKTAENVR